MNEQYEYSVTADWNDGTPVEPGWAHHTSLQAARVAAREDGPLAHLPVTIWRRRYPSGGWEIQERKRQP